MTFSQAWENKIDTENLPLYMRNLVEYKFDDFKEKILHPTDDFIDSITDSLINGDVYVIKNVIDKDVIDAMKKRVFQWNQSTEDSFYKMNEGIPDFHRKVDAEISQNYTFRSIWRMNNFFRWNGDELDLFKTVDDCWSVLKVLSGYNQDSFVENTPKDIIIDRLQICQYPKGGGFLEVHSDPYEIRKTIMCIKMSEKGVDYEGGGLYMLNSKKEKIYVEDKIEVGDVYFAFPWLLHGIDDVSNDEEINWDSRDGRWVMLLNTLQSNEMAEKDRIKMGFAR